MRRLDVVVTRRHLPLHRIGGLRQLSHKWRFFAAPSWMSCNLMRSFSFEFDFCRFECIRALMSTISNGAAIRHEPISQKAVGCSNTHPESRYHDGSDDVDLQHEAGRNLDFQMRWLDETDRNWNVMSCIRPTNCDANPADDEGGWGYFSSVMTSTINVRSIRDEILIYME